MELPVDIYESIILHADIDNISSICTTSTAINKLGNNKNAWVQKFENSHLPIITMQENLKNWIEEYKRVKHAKFYSQVIEIVVKEAKFNDNSTLLIIDFKVTDDIIDLLPPSLKSKIISHGNYKNLISYNDYKQSIFINLIDNCVTVKYFVGDVERGIEKIYKKNDGYMNVLELQCLLFNLLYHFPQMDITDDSEGSYLKINDLDKFTPYIMYMNMLQKRNDFWKNLL